jgi:hypothetical protein
MRSVECGKRRSQSHAIGMAEFGLYWEGAAVAAAVLGKEG